MKKKNVDYGTKKIWGVRNQMWCKEKKNGQQLGSEK